MSALIAAGIALHLAGLACCSLAALFAHRLGRREERKGWAICAGAFVGLAMVRLFGTEELARQQLRAQLVLAGQYDQRWASQSVLAVAVFLAAMALFALVLRQYLRRHLRRDLGRRKSGRTRLLLAAQLALLGFLPLLALRVLSWHQTDRLLYDGPVRLNWILELLLALVPMIAAALYVRHSLRQQRHDLARRRAEEFGRHG